MLGIIVGTICLVAFVRLWKRRHSGRHGEGARRWMLRRLSRHLNASPAQE